MNSHFCFSPPFFYIIYIILYIYKVLYTCNSIYITQACRAVFAFPTILFPQLGMFVITMLKERL